MFSFCSFCIDYFFKHSYSNFVTLDCIYLVIHVLLVNVVFLPSLDMFHIYPLLDECWRMKCMHVYMLATALYAEPHLQELHVEQFGFTVSLICGIINIFNIWQPF
jgi:hypothetical protein